MLGFGGEEAEAEVAAISKRDWTAHWFSECQAQRITAVNRRGTSSAPTHSDDMTQVQIMGIARVHDINLG